MTTACSPIGMQAALSSEKVGSKPNPSCAQKALLRSRSATGRVTKSMRPGCAGAVMADHSSLATAVYVSVDVRAGSDSSEMAARMGTP